MTQPDAPGDAARRRAAAYVDLWERQVVFTAANGGPDRPRSGATGTAPHPSPSARAWRE